MKRVDEFGPSPCIPQTLPCYRDLSVRAPNPSWAKPDVVVRSDINLLELPPKANGPEVLWELEEALDFLNLLGEEVRHSRGQARKREIEVQRP